MMRQTGPAVPRVVIVGGGLSGAAVAFHLARQVTPGQVDIAVVEPRPELGRGVAYSTLDPDHRLNVPDHKMSLFSADLGDFRHWLAAAGSPPLPGGSATLRGDIFAPRHVFGRYVADRLKPLLDAGVIRHVRSTAVAAEAGPDGFRIGLGDGTTLQADTLVLALAHSGARLPPELAALRGHPVLIEDPLAPGALDRVGPRDRVLIIGNGLTSADIVATLSRKGHFARIHALSRHGWRSREHGPVQPQTTADFARDPATTARGLMRRVRAALVADAASGLTWHAVFDQLRAQGPAIWAALPVPERRRFLRHLRSLWDVHRFRIAPQTQDHLVTMQRTHRLDHVAGRLRAVALASGTATVSLRRRGLSDVATLEAERVILATGPDHASVTVTNPLLADLAARGLILPDPLGLGIATGGDGRAACAVPGLCPPILVAGPLARGTVGELMGVPEVIAWAEHVARQVAMLTGPDMAAQGAPGTLAAE